MNLKALKNMYLKSPYFKILVLFIFASLIVLPLLVFGEGFVDEGYKLPAYQQKRLISFHSSSINAAAISAMCLTNGSDKSYFVPTKTLGEMNRFFAKSSTLNVDATPNCCGDFICDVSESSNDCPGDCGTAYECPASISVSDAYAGTLEYPTVQIGRECWLAKNLNAGTRIDLATTASDNGVTQKYCQNNDTNNCAIYGGLYQWNEAMAYSTFQKAQGICPSGWHIPTNEEFAYLASYLGGASSTGSHLKEIGTSHWTSGNSDADNTTGFSAFGSGYGINPNFLGFGSQALFWSSTRADANTSNYWSLSSANANLSGGAQAQANSSGLAVRCVRDVLAPIYIINYSVNSEFGTNGAITGSSTQRILPGKDGTAVTALPLVGYEFANWSDGMVGSSRTDKNIHANLTLQANFAPSAPPVCGDGICNGSETTVSCAADCSAGCCLTAESSTYPLSSPWYCSRWSCTSLLGDNNYCEGFCYHADDLNADNYYRLASQASSTMNVIGSNGSTNCRTYTRNTCLQQQGQGNCLWSEAMPACDRYCGDGICSPGTGESCHSCALDCGYCSSCGDGTCSFEPGSLFETCNVCPLDCGRCAGYCLGILPENSDYCTGFATESECTSYGNAMCFWQGQYPQPSQY